jgi:hypothetical protein
VSAKTETWVLWNKRAKKRWSPLIRFVRKSGKLVTPNGESLASVTRRWLSGPDEFTRQYYPKQYRRDMAKFRARLAACVWRPAKVVMEAREIQAR